MGNKGLQRGRICVVKCFLSGAVFVVGGKLMHMAVNCKDFDFYG